MQLMSATFQHESTIPVECTGDGNNTSPELSWRDAPAQTKSFAITMHDPDAQRPGGFTHWLLYDIPANVATLEPIMPKEERVPGTGVQGKNDFGKIGYMGPSPPPSQKHRYFLRLYALDIDLALAPGASYEELQRAIDGHIIETAELMGSYSRPADRAA